MDMSEIAGLHFGVAPFFCQQVIDDKKAEIMYTYSSYMWNRQ